MQFFATRRALRLGRYWRLAISVTALAVLGVRPGIAAPPEGAAGTSAANLLTNPNFDTGVAGWDANAAWDPNHDADGNPHSGSLFVSATDTNNFCTSATQCVAVTPGAYQLSGKIFVPTGSYPAGARAEIIVFWEPSTNCCTGGALPNGTTQELHLATTQNTWVSVSTGLSEAPAGTQSALVAPIECSGSSGTLAANFDDLVLQAVPGSCVPSSTTLCIDDFAGDHRFAVNASFATSQAGGLSGTGAAIPLASLGVTHGGLMWFFSADNPELLIKVLSACSFDNAYWVFISGGTNVGFHVTVTDTITGHQKTYINPDLHAAAPVQDTVGLPCS